MKKIFSLLSILILPLSVSAMSFENSLICDNPPELCERPRCPRHSDMKQRLNLTEEQKAQARVLRLESQAKLKPFVEELKSKQSQKMVLVSQGGDEKEIKLLGDDIKRLKQQIHSVIIQNERDFVQILTSEQRVEFNKMRAEGKIGIQSRRFNGHFSK